MRHVPHNCPHYKHLSLSVYERLSCIVRVAGNSHIARSLNCRKYIKWVRYQYCECEFQQTGQATCATMITAKLNIGIFRGNTVDHDWIKTWQVRCILFRLSHDLWLTPLVGEAETVASALCQPLSKVCLWVKNVRFPPRNSWRQYLWKTGTSTMVYIKKNDAWAWRWNLRPPIPHFEMRCCVRLNSDVYSTRPTHRSATR